MDFSQAPLAFCPRCAAPHPSDAACSASPFGDADTLRAGGPEPIPLTVEAEPDPLVGQQVGSFKIGRRLGRGGMGAVYLGEHPGIGSRVAIKFLRPEYAEQPELVRRLYAEARAANLAGHENIVRVLDLSRHPQRGYYLVMEYVPGETLGARLARGPVSLPWARQVLGQLCGALGAVHAHGIVHRDLKPDNVMVLETRDGPFVKVMDFGIAKLREGTLGGTVQGAILGTPEYIAPEQCDGRPVDARADLYALGAIAFQLATGRLPFTGANVTQLLVAHLTQQPPSPRSLRPDLPAAWEAAILRALAKRPEDRFADVAGFVAALDAPAPAPLPAAVQSPTRHRVSVEVGLAAPSGEPVQVRAVDLSRGGALLAYEAEPPPLFSRVQVVLPSPHGPLRVEAEVVRHVTEDDARAWGLEPGFAVQFAAPSATLAAAIDALVRGRPRVEPPAPPPGGALTPQQRVLLARYAAQATASHYDVLGLQPDATRAQIVEHGRKAVAELRELESRPLTSAHALQVRACLQRVAAALATLGSVRERLRYDARRGNAAGVAQALAAGCSRELVQREDREFAGERPEVPSRVELHLARARLAKRNGNLPAAVREVAAALELDPLSLTAHDLHLELRRLANAGP